METNNRLPETLIEAVQYFSDPDNCLAFVIKLRWPNGIVCPRCDCPNHYFLSTRRVWKCKGCNKQFSAKVGTIFEDSPIGFEKWLPTVWMIANCKNGVSSYEIMREIGVTQKTAWFMLHRIRLAMQTGSFIKFSGKVEADETYIGGLARNMHKDKKFKLGGRGTAGKTIVMGILERHGPGKSSKVRAKVIPDTGRVTLQPEVRANVEPGARLFTDEHSGYEGLNQDFVHQVINHMESYVRGSVHTNGIENFWSLLKRTLRGTYVSVEPFHLHRYVDEQSYRFNNRDGNNIERLVKIIGGVVGKRITYKRLTGKENPPRLLPT